MLDRRNQEPVTSASPSPTKSLEGQVVRLRGRGGKHDLLAPAPGEQGHLGPGRFHHLPGPLSLTVRRARIHESLRQERAHG